jgi:hypothetical protein
MGNYQLSPRSPWQAHHRMRGAGMGDAPTSHCPNSRGNRGLDNMTQCGKHTPMHAMQFAKLPDPSAEYLPAAQIIAVLVVLAAGQ